LHQSAISILLDCLSYTSRPEKTERLKNVTTEQWRVVAQLEQSHSVEPLLYHILNSLDIAACPSDVFESLNQVYQKNMLRNIRLYQVLNKLLRRLQEKGVETIVLKGAYLADAVYDNIGLRSMGDIDLLVKRDDLSRVEQEMFALGFVPEDINRVITQDNRHFGYKLPANGLIVEVHWNILSDDYPFLIDVNELWDRARPVTLLQASALAFSPEDLLLHLCTHTADHVRVIKIRMLYDIGEVVRHFDSELNWQEIGTRACQWDASRPVYIMLRLAQELLNVPIPEDWLVSFQPDNFDDSYIKIAEELVTAERNDIQGTSLGSPTLAQLWGSKDLSDKLALLRKRLLPSRETLSLQYPAPANSWRIYLYYPVLLKDYLVMYGAELWGLVRGDSKIQAAANHSNQISALRDWMMKKRK
jgi:hypothetical protein